MTFYALFSTLMIIICGDKITWDNCQNIDTITHGINCVFYNEINQNWTYINITKHIGNGCYSDVWLGTDMDTNEKYVIKDLKSDDDAVITMDLHVSGEIISKQNSFEHSNIIQIYFVTTNMSVNSKLIIMEYIEDGSLYDIFESKRKLTFWAAKQRNPLYAFIDFIVQIRFALVSLNTINEGRILMYNDMKMDNIVYTDIPHPRYLLIDFGLCQYTDNPMFRYLGNILSISPMCLYDKTPRQSFIKSYHEISQMYGLIITAVDVMRAACVIHIQQGWLRETLINECKILNDIFAFNSYIHNQSRCQRRMNRTQMYDIKRLQMNNTFWNQNKFSSTPLSVFIKKLLYDVNVPGNDIMYTYDWKSIFDDLNGLIQYYIDEIRYTPGNRIIQL